ncbi:MAG: Fic family protein [Gammaproteobacteria bacterium]|nr:Fic family protein [Gammaproteobacteria bacterium]
MTQSPLSVATLRSGVFRFQVAVDVEQTAMALQRVEDAQTFLNKMPLVPDVATRLKRELVALSAFGNNSIDGGTLSEEHIVQLLDGAIPAQDEKDQRILNLQSAYEEIDRIAQAHDSEGARTPGQPQTGIVITEQMIKSLHTSLTKPMPHQPNQSGEYRDNAMGQITKVGTLEHGGIYTPPKCREDIELLMRAFLEWLNSATVSTLSPLIRATLAHFYFYRIHPFWEGNGRVGRALEMVILKSAGYHYSHYALARYYFEHKEEYLTIYNPARKSEDRHPNTAFVQFFLQGMFDVINRAHERASHIIAGILFENRLQHLLKGKKINVRQHAIVAQLMSLHTPPALADLQAQPWYDALYQKLSPKTRSRDILGLAEYQLAALSPDGQLRLLIP